MNKLFVSVLKINQNRLMDSIYAFPRYPIRASGPISYSDGYQKSLLNSSANSGVVDRKDSGSFLNCQKLRMQHHTQPCIIVGIQILILLCHVELKSTRGFI